MSRKRKGSFISDPLDDDSSDDDSTSISQPPTKKSKEHSCMKYYKRLDKKMDLMQRNMDVKFNYMELLLQKILQSQTNETPFTGLQLSTYNSSRSQSPSSRIKTETPVSL